MSQLDVRRNNVCHLVLRDTYLSIPPTTISFSSSPLGSNGNSNTPERSAVSNGPRTRASNIGAIVGGVVGGLVAIAAGVALFYWRRRRQGRRSHCQYKARLSEHTRPYPYGATERRDSDPQKYMDAPSIESSDAAIDSSPVNALGGPSPQLVFSGSKAREHAGDMEQATGTGYLPPLTPRREVLVETESSGSQSTSHSLSTTDIVGLRIEVENLRRTVHGIREERLEPPPQYRE